MNTRNKKNDNTQVAATLQRYEHERDILARQRQSFDKAEKVLTYGEGKVVMTAQKGVDLGCMLCSYGKGEEEAEACVSCVRCIGRDVISDPEGFSDNYTPDALALPAACPNFFLAPAL